MMERKILGIVLFSILLIGCSSSTGKNEQGNYIVVEMPSGTIVNDLFDFESVSKIALDAELSKSGVKDGCYCIGKLQDGNSIVWRLDDDGTGYDDCLFIYVQDTVSDVQVMTYAAKLKETPISYESFKEKYE